MAINTKSITQLITEFRALQAKDAITPESLGYILQRIISLFEYTVDEGTFTKSNAYVRDLGLFASVDDALQAAAAREIVDNRALSILHWHTEGDAGTILMSRWGGNYVTQLLFMHEQSRTTKVRLITAGGNYKVGDWQNIVMPVRITYDATTRELRFAGIKETTAVPIPTATKSADGLMPKTIYSALSGFTLSVPEVQGEFHLNLEYSDPVNGSKKSVSLPQATIRQAGVMTADDKQRANLAIEGTSARFDDIVYDAEVMMQSTTQAGGKVVYIRSKKAFAYRLGNAGTSRYCNNWYVKGVTSADLFMNEARTAPLKNKVYVLDSELYIWNEAVADLVSVQRNTASLARLQGRASESSALTDPFLLLGQFSKESGESTAAFWKRVNTAIDSTFSLAAGADNAKYCGEMRLNVNGSIITLHQIAISFAAGKYQQIISGAVQVDTSGKITVCEETYARYFRFINKGVAGAWNACTLSPKDKVLIDSYGATVGDLGTFSSVDEALQAAAAREIVDDRSLRVLQWRTDGDGGTILMSRWGGHYVTQYLFMHGQPRECKARMITGGGNYQVSDWVKLLIPSAISYNDADRSIVLTDIRGQQLYKIPLPEATTLRAGLMTKEMVAAFSTNTNQIQQLKKKVEDMEKLLNEIRTNLNAETNI